MTLTTKETNMHAKVTYYLFYFVMAATTWGFGFLLAKTTYY